MSHTALQSLELALMTFEPDAFVPKYFRSVDDVAVHRSILRRCAYSDAAIEHLVGLVWDRVSQNRRKNLIYGLQAIKWLLANREKSTRRIPPSTIDRLFDIYTHFIFDPLGEIRRCVSVILKEKTLRRHQVRWLVKNANASEHIVNRLLRYPRFDPLIEAWARLAIQNPELHARRAELLGRLIADNLPPEAGSLPSEAILWGIYFSSANMRTKQSLIIQCASTENLEAALEICLRLGLVDPIRELRNKVLLSK
jgi:hypothetical protein